MQRRLDTVRTVTPTETVLWAIMPFGGPDRTVGQCASQACVIYWGLQIWKVWQGLAVESVSERACALSGRCLLLHLSSLIQYLATGV